MVTVMYWLLVFDWTDPKLRVISFLTHGEEKCGLDPLIAPPTQYHTHHSFFPSRLRNDPELLIRESE